MIVQELVRAGKSLVDARCGGSSGCVEVGAFGKENYNLTGYLNLPKIYELALHNGRDPRTDVQLGPQTGDATQFTSFDEVFEAYRTQLTYFVDVKVRGNNVIERLYARYMPSPFLSLLIDDCIATGRDYHDGGARYNTSYIQGVGLGTLTDAMTAVKYHVYDTGALTMADLLAMLDRDFEGHERERLMLVNRTPRYGNDDDYADSIMRAIFESYYAAVDGRRNTKGGEYHINLLPTTCHVYFGSVMIASPDGRRGQARVRGHLARAGRGPLRADRRAALRGEDGSPPHGRHAAQPEVHAGAAGRRRGLDNLVQLMRTYFRLDGHHIQFNVVDAATLRKAQRDPEQYRDLIVRAAGYSDYFCDLSLALQEEIIARTEHQTF